MRRGYERRRAGLLSTAPNAQYTPDCRGVTKIHSWSAARLWVVTGRWACASNVWRPEELTLAPLERPALCVSRWGGGGAGRGMISASREQAQAVGAGVKPGLYPWSLCGFWPRGGMQGRLAALAAFIRWSAPLGPRFSWSATG